MKINTLEQIIKASMFYLLTILNGSKSMMIMERIPQSQLCCMRSAVVYSGRPTGKIWKSSLSKKEKWKQKEITRRR